MKRSRFSEEQIIGFLTEHEAGATCADLCRKHGLSEATFYNWKAKYGGMTDSDAKRLKALEDENARLKQLLAEQMLDDLLNETLFRDLAHARSAIRAWAADYNEERPHSAPGYQTPRAFAEGLFTATDSRTAPQTSSAHMSVAPPSPIGVSTQRAPVPAG